MPKLVVVGMGYVGIPVACAFADKDFEVVGLDIVRQKVDSINKGVYPIAGAEPELADLLNRLVRERKFRASTDFSECANARYILICVETPLDPKTQRMNTTALKSATVSVGKNLIRGTLVSVESTIAPMTMQKLIRPILEVESGLKAEWDFHLVHCPERVMAGRLMHNLRKYDRVVGGVDERSTKLAIELYGHVCEGRLYATDALTAEVVKTAENSYRDVQIAFANEMALICDELGVDVFEARKLVNSCPYRDMHKPGPGVGGHCLPKDPHLLLSSLKKYQSRIIKASRELNDSMPLYVVRLVEDALKEADIETGRSKVALLGLSYLENSGDTRNSPSIVVLSELEKKGARVVVHDPYADHEDVDLLRSVDECLRGADCVVVLTAHDVYKSLDLQRMGELLRNKVVVDCKNLFNRDKVIKSGFVYRGLGQSKL